MLLLGLLLSAHALVHPNGLIEVRIDRGSLLSGLPGLERGLRVAQAEPATGLPTATGLLLILQDASERTESDRAVLATREGSTRLDLLRREYAALEAIRTLSRTMPVIAASTGELSDASAALFLAASHRVCTERSTLELTGCRIGLCPALASLLDLVPPSLESLAMCVALGGTPLSCHDLRSLRLLTHFVRSKSLPAMLAELRHAPHSHYDVPVDRWSEPVPNSMARLFATDDAGTLEAPLLNQTPLGNVMRSVFGSGVTSVTDLLERLQRERASAAQLANSCAWQTREHAEAALEVLDGACVAFDNSSPRALAATFVAVRKCRESLASAPLATAALGPVELIINSRLATRDDLGVWIERDQKRVRRKRRFATAHKAWGADRKSVV